MTTRLQKVIVLAALIAAAGAGLALAQTNDADPHHPATSGQEASPSDAADGTARQGQEAMPGGMDMMQGMMGRNTMMPSGMPMMAMRGHMMKIMFAVADTDGDGALSFEEVTAVHKRIFDAVDSNKDGKVTTEEIQAFMRP
ncbi:EF-hand domain-containing protein [Rhizobium lentis]|uniref:EF-hand domain-containing protein n=1 Tax=Rhizobium lentis TaxID=1138194 RepID=A0A9Q3QW45_9HYPH|nr:EF-hand domain-containing protein [Rhizobium lentis]MBX5011044.1 EF-hand domain-containing protein [Rhizobium lentis]MBX5021440.1 EF-hand domain-containing protein [Rhizobium lentis]MBX5040125.1 EF-hand domain-containing protein [Rhizobium lentis]MBX5054785.1 EF-hand domain-containing protein [Rhizobium lentis]MBX5063594.1 EF-hand domain-containing protein [Rhizobium lentis]